ncbi:unnamed protein product, partial [Pylaiella littoralis]
MQREEGFGYEAAETSKQREGQEEGCGREGDGGGRQAHEGWQREAEAAGGEGKDEGGGGGGGGGGGDWEVGSSVQWTERGIPNFAGTAAHENRNKRSSKSEVSLSQKARDKMPSLDDFMDTLDPDTG